MTCYSPITAFKPADGGAISFREVVGSREVNIACGQCIGCRIAKRDSWAFRCYAESRMYRENSFVTLTYDNDNIPTHGSLNYSDVQSFHHRLRKRLGPFRFFVVGEYGEQTLRPHYHALYFGLSFPDAVKSNSVYSKHDVFESKLLSDCWGKGQCSIGSVTYESARYCAVYTTKKITGDLAELHYSRLIKETGELVQVDPEFARMSLKPGIGASWFDKYYPEVLAHKGVHVNNRKQKIPSYFMSRLEVMQNDDYEALKLDLMSKVDLDNCTRERLEVREICAKAKSKLYSEKSNAL